MTNLAELIPDIKISINQIFGIDTEMKVDGFSKKNGPNFERVLYRAIEFNSKFFIINAFNQNKHKLYDRIKGGKLKKGSGNQKRSTQFLSYNI